ncbi:hypothetical protein [Helicobacter brantae]|uniref:Uncharacterized protein n=1 Tax=Helicobacter brantae TaxID=375927 RepID=A0A3D8J4X4_9HELI|nr:hypothetical protein [Helicobacter brantae]RDU71831.1 hypothetical protein CQA58_01965 [Helicobacter brantae]
MNRQEIINNYDENQILSKEEYEQYFNECEETIRSIKLHAIKAIEKRDKTIANLEKKLNEEQGVVNRQIEGIRSKTDKIGLIEEVLKELKDLVENKNNSELVSLKKALEGKKIELKNEQEAHSKLKTDCEEKEKQYDDNKREWEQKEKALNERIEAYEQIEDEKNNIEADLKNLREEIHYELYEQYCNLPSDFRNEFTYIVPINIFAFLQTSGRERILQELHTFIHGAITNNQPWVEDLKSFFDLLFKASQTYNPSLKRLETKEGDDYNSKEMISIKGELIQRRVADVLFLGYKQDNMTKESLVEVK